jgi:hypothetical protein
LSEGRKGSGSWIVKQYNAFAKERGHRSLPDSSILTYQEDVVDFVDRRSNELRQIASVRQK